MYKVEGIIGFQKSPEELIGEFGILHVPDADPTDNNVTVESPGAIWLTGHELLVRNRAQDYESRGIIPAGVEVIQFKTVEVANKFTPEYINRVKARSILRPDLGKLALKKIGKENLLTMAALITAKNGEVVERAGYDPEHGWVDMSEIVGEKPALSMGDAVPHGANAK